MTSQTPYSAARPIMLGGNVFGWTADEETSFALLDRFVDRGFSLVDTADVYSSFIPGNAGGESETVIGNWIRSRGRRGDIVISTKVGMWDKHPGLGADNIATAVEDSLRRLRTDHIEIYFAHLWDEKVPVAETMGAFSRLVEQGKIGTIGVSNWSGAQVAQGLAAGAKIGMMQPLYNLCDRAGFEADLAQVALDNRIAVVPFFGLASGFLSGRYRSKADIAGKARAQILEGYMTPRGLRILDALDQVSSAIGSTPARVALAWLIHQPAVTAPIVSATSIAQLDDVLGAVDVELTAEALALLDKASAELGAGRDREEQRMSSEERIIRDYLDALTRRDWNGALAYFADDASFWIAGEAMDKARFAGALDMVDKLFAQGPAFEIVDLFACGTRAAMQMKVRATVASGKEYTNQYALIFTFAGGRIVGLAEYLDTARITAALA